MASMTQRSTECWVLSYELSKSILSATLSPQNSTLMTFHITAELLCPI